MPETRHITLPKGFLAAGVKCGIKASGKEDLAIIASAEDAAAAVLTTQNQIVGAPVLWCRNVLPSGYGRVRAAVINSGCSNVCTGTAGLRDAQRMAVQTAARLGTVKQKVLVASTGIIGHRLPMDKVAAGIDAAAARLGTHDDPSVLRAIMTTDTREKSAVVQTRLNGHKTTIAGVVKGSGMIAPSLATMISVITTDAAVSPPALHRALVAASDVSFNAITVDSDTSTSDTVIALACGAAGNRTVLPGSPDYRLLLGALAEVCTELARAVVVDGEGATKIIEITVRGAAGEKDAELAAKSVANSPLLKCAVHGGDPNWGRIACALGKSAARVRAQTLRIAIGGVTVFSRGLGRKFNLPRVEKHLAGKEIRIDCDLGIGKGSFTAWTCDLSREYIAINADYHT